MLQGDVACIYRYHARYHAETHANYKPGYHNSYKGFLSAKSHEMFAESVNVQRQVPIVTFRSDKPYVKRIIDMNTLREKSVKSDGRIPKVSWPELSTQCTPHMRELSNNCLARFDTNTRSLDVFVHAQNAVKHFEFINMLPDDDKK